MAGQDPVSPASWAPGRPGSSKLGNLRSRQTQSNVIAVMSKGSRSADAQRLQRGGSCRRGWRAPSPTQGLRTGGRGRRPAPPPRLPSGRPVAGLGSGSLPLLRPRIFSFFLSFRRTLSLPLPPRSDSESPLPTGRAHSRCSMFAGSGQPVGVLSLSQAPPVRYRLVAGIPALVPPSPSNSDACLSSEVTVGRGFPGPLLHGSPLFGGRKHRIGPQSCHLSRPRAFQRRPPAPRLSTARGDVCVQGR